MIHVTIHRSKEGFIRSFTMKGHADFAEHGKDIVCAGASAVSFGAVNAIKALANVDMNVEQSEEGGFLHVQVPDQVDTDSYEKIQLLLEGMLVSLQTIERGYGKFIRIVTKKD